MKSDIPRLMMERNLDALMILGPDGLGSANTAFTYLTGRSHITNGTIIVKRTAHADIQSYLVHTPMERDEAARTGLQLINLASYKMPEIVQQMNGDRLAARVEFTRRLFGDLGIEGRVGFYGIDQVASSYAFLSALQRDERVEVVAEYENDVLTEARKTKDQQEVAQIKLACDLTGKVIDATRDFLQRQRVASETLTTPDGKPLTIGDVKAFIRQEEARLGLEDADCIFAIGRDAGVPHSSGTPGDPIMLGKTIVFDIFPHLPGGYYADITRTWCPGYASDAVLQAYELVMQVHAATAASFNTQQFTYEFQEAACGTFESHGHPTIRRDYTTTNGYIHGLGHGFGLAVHEPPNMGLRGSQQEQKLIPGTIITNEPGLYYPDKGWGVRVEDDYWCNPQGVFECLTDVDRALVLPMLSR